jgi:hypothetical protein
MAKLNSKAEKGEGGLDEKAPIPLLQQTVSSPPSAMKEATHLDAVQRILVVIPHEATRAVHKVPKTVAAAKQRRFCHAVVAPGADVHIHHAPPMPTHHGRHVGVAFEAPPLIQRNVLSLASAASTKKRQKKKNKEQNEEKKLTAGFTVRGPFFAAGGSCSSGGPSSSSNSEIS